MFVFTVLIVSLLCLAFDSTRMAGVIGLALLFYLYPLMFILCLVLGCVGVYFIHHHQK